MLELAAAHPGVAVLPKPFGLAELEEQIHGLAPRACERRQH